MLIFILTKHIQPSSVWRCLEILHKTLFQLKKDCYISAMFYQSVFMVFNYGTLTKHYFHTLSKFSEGALLWILGAFHIFLTFGIKAITRLIPIHLYIYKLNSRFQLRTYSLPLNHVIKLLLETRPSIKVNTHYLLLKELMPK